MRKIIIAVALLFTSSATAHELTPTYPKFKPSYIDGILVTTMSLWNRRDDVQYYEIAVFDKTWHNISFATAERIVKLPYLERKQIDVYIKESDKNNVEYICTTSKQLKDDVESTGIKSMICSRIVR